MTSFLDQVNTLSGQTVQLCYHCHKCTAGCPVAVEMEYGPDRVLRLVQLGEKERVLTSRDIWICASCETCGTRCPNEINIAEVMDALRVISLAEEYSTPEPNAPAFHRLFLGIVGRTGRFGHPDVPQGQDTAAAAPGESDERGQADIQGNGEIGIWN